jgi:hypothetical protein
MSHFSDYAERFYCDLICHSPTSVVQIGDRSYGDFDHPFLKWIRPIADDVHLILRCLRQMPPFFSPFEEKSGNNFRFGYRVAVDDSWADGDIGVAKEALSLYFYSLQSQLPLDIEKISAESPDNSDTCNSNIIIDLVNTIVTARVDKIGGSEIIYPYTVDIGGLKSLTMLGNYAPRPTIPRNPPEPCEVVARIMGIGRPKGGTASVDMDVLVPETTKVKKLIAVYVRRNFGCKLNGILHDEKFYRISLTYQKDLKGNMVSSVKDISLNPVSDTEMKIAKQ